MQEPKTTRPRDRKTPLPERAGSRTLYRAFYGTCVVVGAVALFGSMALQLWGPASALDGIRPHRHQIYCTGRLWALRQELEEATVQDFARGRRAPELTRTEAARRRTWRDRLDEVSARCRDLPQQHACAEQLGTLEVHYTTLVDGMHAARQELAEPLDAQLEALK